MDLIEAAETVAHIRENGRVTILFHAFEGPARIVRLYGKGKLGFFLIHTWWSRGFPTRLLSCV